ncbi:hypothetical protein [Streptomyces sp. NBC_00996]|uniref:hypothetical protein n=1 Tax=Streptomyces sp. NBC_00996 TaxID=2903710 RepID=UPI00386F365C|nr:hypothetical protein OG390_44070 [Streptomyces sp. NBC_00996]
MNVPVRAAADLRLLRAAVFSAVCVTLSAAGHVLASGTGIALWSLAVGWFGVLCVAGLLAGRERSLVGIALGLPAGEVGLHFVFCLGQSSAAAVTGVTAAPADRSERVVAAAERLLCGAQAVQLSPRSAARILRQAGIDPAKAVGGPRAMPPMHTMSGMTGMAGHGAHAMPLMAMATLPMLAAHAAAAVVAGWVLRRCEIALWQTVRWPAVIADRFARFAVLCWLSGLLAAVRMPALVAAVLELLLSSRLPRRMADVRARLLRPLVLGTCVVRRGPPVVAAAA